MHGDGWEQERDALEPDRVAARVAGTVAERKREAALGPHIRAPGAPDMVDSRQPLQPALMVAAQGYSMVRTAAAAAVVEG